MHYTSPRITAAPLSQYIESEPPSLCITSASPPPRGSKRHKEIRNAFFGLVRFESALYICCSSVISAGIIQIGFVSWLNEISISFIGNGRAARPPRALQRRLGVQAAVNERRDTESAGKSPSRGFTLSIFLEVLRL